MPTRLAFAIALLSLLASPAFASQFIPNKCAFAHCAVTAVEAKWPSGSDTSALPLSIGPNLVIQLPTVPAALSHDRDLLRAEFDDARVAIQYFDAQNLELPAAYGFEPEHADFVEYLRIAFEMTPDEEPKPGTAEFVLFRYAMMHKAMQRFSEGTRPARMQRGDLVSYTFESEPLRGRESRVAFVANSAAPYGFIKVHALGLSDEAFRRLIGAIEVQR